MIDTILQAVVFITGIFSALLFSCTSDVRRYAYIAVACGQPCWLYVTFVSHQWGMFGLSVFYTAMAARGLINTWSKFLKEGEK